MDGRSTTGFVMLLCGATVCYYSKKQSIVADSTMMAETIAAIEASKELIWLQELLNNLGFPHPSPLVLLMDSQSAMGTANGGGNFNKTKHLRIRHFQLEEYVTTGFIRLEYIKSEDNLADIFTKLLLGPRFNMLGNYIMGSV
jgi:hypothetical protein